MQARPTLLCGALALVAAAIAVTALIAPARYVASQPEPTAPPLQRVAANAPTTQVYGHNLLIRQGPALQIYIPWFRGRLVPTHPGTIPSLDDRDSFFFQLDQGVVRLQLRDLSHFLSSGTIAHAPFSNVTLAEQGGELVMHATLHKVVPLRAMLRGTLQPAGGNLVAFHVSHISVLKVPLHGLFSVFHLTLSDFVQSHAAGIRMQGDTIYFNAETLPPAPHFSGPITSVRLIRDPLGPAIETIYGNAHDDTVKEKKWRDFLQMEGGSLEFGRLTMRDVDMILVDANAKAPWFDLALAQYQTQLVYGVTRITPQEGLQVFMPGLNQLPDSEPSAVISREWLKNRYLPSPPSAPQH